MVTTGILPLQGKIPIVEPGIEPGTSWLVVGSSDHQTTRLVNLEINPKNIQMSVSTSQKTLLRHREVAINSVLCQVSRNI